MSSKIFIVLMPFNIYKRFWQNFIPWLFYLYLCRTMITIEMYVQCLHDKYLILIHTFDKQCCTFCRIYYILLHQNLGFIGLYSIIYKKMLSIFVHVTFDPITIGDHRCTRIDWMKHKMLFLYKGDTPRFMVLIRHQSTTM